MTVIGLDDTDSRDRGMCTTYVAHLIVERLREHDADAESSVGRPLLVRLNPAIKHKTRGNAALALHTTLDLDVALPIARDVVDRLAETEDPNTNPGVVAAPDPAEWNQLGAYDAVLAFSRAALRDRLTIADVERVLDVTGYRSESWGNGRGRIGALAAIGAWIGWNSKVDSVDEIFGDWTYECISYREPEQWGSRRTVDSDSIFRAATDGYPAVWDTVDRGEREAVCVPHTPCPILHGIRGDDPSECERIAKLIESEPVAAREIFVTNQGTDVHLRDGTIGSVADGRAYQVTGTITAPPETKRGGHVFLTIESENQGGDTTLQCAAFEPTKRFREHVRALRSGDRITACGEVSSGTLKLEKFAVRALTTTRRVTPTCPDCERRMKSAGRNQGYRCRDCGTSAEDKVDRPIERTLELGWYEVPPCARRHIAKPLIRGGFDAQTHPER
ncbi:tRNA(Ile)(2)-agmatinylcytidine synthase [Halocatena marina]|uniref:tRNA(Ile)(2)-agmatinylcytidine synthase n=1 Tax=Halocatena marina TaxID=2934937 RepID=UPI00200D0752|nr:tRNA(Ile)(2)-agmatinylcytidine synthase [Halocatena marina]